MKLPRISGKEYVKALQKAGFIVRRQAGSHIIMRKESPFCQLVVPNHSELDTGTLRAIIRDSKLSVEEFIQLL